MEVTQDIVERLRVTDPVCQEHHTQNEAADTIAALRARLAEVARLQSLVSSSEAQRYKDCSALLTRTEAAEAALATARADALREAAAALDARGAREQVDFGLGRETQNFFRARDIVRALIDKDAAIPAHRRSPMEHERDAE
jgi:hypothetical protein